MSSFLSRNRLILLAYAGMIVLLFGGAPRDNAHPTWLNKLAQPMELLIFGAVLMGIGVYWWFMLYYTQQKRKRKR